MSAELKPKDPKKAEVVTSQKELENEAKHPTPSARKTDFFKGDVSSPDGLAALEREIEEGMAGFVY